MKIEVIINALPPDGIVCDNRRPDRFCSLSHPISPKVEKKNPKQYLEKQLLSSCWGLEKMPLGNVEMWRSIFREASSVSLTFIKCFCCFHVTRTYLLDAAYVLGPSMLPTINMEGTIVLVDRFSPRFGKVSKGDIVIVRSPENPRKIVTKRLIAMEGDNVTFLVDPKKSDKSETVVPKGHLWVQGDNVYASRDSRAFGPVPDSFLHGKVFWKVWPMKDFGPL